MTTPSWLQTIVRQICLLLIAAGLAATGAALVLNAQIDWAGTMAEGQISLTAAIARQSPVLWIDARSADEFNRKHIPGALLLNEAEWSSLLPAVLEKWEPNQMAIIYCDSPDQQASHEIAERLREIKLGPVFVLNGGWQTWRQK